MYLPTHSVSLKTYTDLPTEPYSNQPPRDIQDSPDYLLRRKNEDYPSSYSIA